MGVIGANQILVDFTKTNNLTHMNFSETEQ